MSQSHARERLERAYHDMVERAKLALDAAEPAARLEHAIDSARRTAVELGEMTREEADWISTYVRRDLKELGDYVNRTGEEYRSWFYMDLELIEANLFRLMTGIADQTRLELDALSRQANTYRTGEIAGPGTLGCTDCGKHLEFTRAGHIPPCSHCNGSLFVRVTE